MKTGTVRTNIQGSDATFDVCPIDQWEEMSQEQREKILIESMWESGILDVFIND